MQLAPSEGLIEEFAAAKINLDLVVLGKRTDGYHDIDSLVHFLPFGDRLQFKPADKLELSIDGPFGANLKVEDNLVLRAARLLAEHSNCEALASIKLTKNLPVASGMGGGSSDAAATLRGLNRLWGCRLSLIDLVDLALPLGADVPVCVYGGAARLRGIGERIDPVRSLPEMPLLLVNPGVELSTAHVFRTLVIDEDAVYRKSLLAGPSLDQLTDWLRHTVNELERPAIQLQPVIADVLERLSAFEHVHIARMSGSGATCYALFPDTRLAQAAADVLRREQPDWWIEATTVPPSR